MKNNLRKREEELKKFTSSQLINGLDKDDDKLRKGYVSVWQIGCDVIGHKISIRLSNVMVM